MFRFYIDIDSFYIYYFFFSNHWITKQYNYYTLFPKEFDLKSCTFFVYNNKKKYNSEEK